MLRKQKLPSAARPRPQDAPTHLVCSICEKPVALETAKTDGDGKAVHEHCYLLAINLKRATTDGQG